VRELDRQGHQLRRFITGKTKHQPLIAGATRVDTHRDVGRLSVECRQDSAGVAVEAILGSGVTDLTNRFARDSGVVDYGVGRDLTGDNHQSGGDESFTSYACGWIDTQCGVKYCIRDLIGDFVWMAFSDGLRGEQVSGFASQNSSFMYTQSRIQCRKRPRRLAVCVSGCQGDPPRRTSEKPQESTAFAWRGAKLHGVFIDRSELSPPKNKLFW